MVGEASQMRYDVTERPGRKLVNASQGAKVRESGGENSAPGPIAKLFSVPGTGHHREKRAWGGCLLKGDYPENL